MQLIPAIDIQGGKCVRLRRGDLDSATVFYADPRDAARHWIDCGAQRLHIVDLDGARDGRAVNFEIVQDIARLAAAVPVQIGGGIRDIKTAREYIKAGASHLIIGTQAVRKPEFVRELCGEFPGQIIVGIDARDGMVATEGWTQNSHTTAAECARQFAAAAAIIYTDIARDGMLAGVNIAATAALAAAVDMPVVASGGINSLADLQKLARESVRGGGKLCAVIIGRALYAGAVDLAAAQIAVAEIVGDDFAPKF